MQRKISWFYIAYGVFTLSLVLPAAMMPKPLFGGGGRLQAVFGWQCLLIGWLAMPTWIANPLFAAGGIFLAYQRRRTARVLATLAVVAALVSFLYLGEDVRYFHVGYYVWVASMIAMLVATYEPGETRAAA